VPPPLVSPARRAALRRRLLAWWDAGHRDLPWRYQQHGADPYRVWLAEVMLQQTQVAAALPYFQRFVARWPTLEALAAAPDEEVFAAWSGLGYYARCRNLLAAARAALREHGGLPASLEALRALPGFGPYTAGAVASIAFALPAAAVDGNVARVLARLFHVEGAPAEKATRERLWALAGALVPAERPGDWNQALMELGATVCAPRTPACARCPVAAACAARAAGVERALPTARRRPVRRALAVACAVVEREGRVLLVRRGTAGLFAGLLAFPAVEVPAGSAPRAAISAHLRGELGVAARVEGDLGQVQRVLTHRDLTLHAFDCCLGGKPREREDLRWVERSALHEAGLPSAMRALLPMIETTRRGSSIETTRRGSSIETTRRGSSIETTRRGSSIEATRRGSAIDAGAAPRGRASGPVRNSARILSRSRSG
jgi:A/G-specific adenine glycosylase